MYLQIVQNALLSRKLTYVDLNFRPTCPLRISGPAQGSWLVLQDKGVYGRNHAQGAFLVYD
jgi:hypothetical protein